MNHTAVAAVLSISVGICGVAHANVEEGSDSASEPYLNSPSLCAVEHPAPFSLGSTTTSFNPTDGYWGTWFSQTIESDENVMAERLKSLPVESVHFVRRAPSGIQAGVFRISGGIVVVFRGTADAQEMMQNLLVETEEGSQAGLPGKVHSGFLANFLDLWPEVFAAASRMGAAQSGVWIFAHSLGGSLSHFAAYNFAQQQVEVHGVYTSGTPQSGDADFRSGYNAKLGQKTFMIIFESDIAPNVPPVPEAAKSFENAVAAEYKETVRDLVPRLNYRQVGRQYTIDRNGTFQKIDDLGLYQTRYFEKLRAENPGKFLPYLLRKNSKYITNHDLENYRCAVRALPAFRKFSP